MLRCILQQTKPSCINVKGNPHSPGRTVCSGSGTHDTGFKYVVPTLLDGNEDLAFATISWLRISLALSLALFLRRSLLQILVFTRSLPRQISTQIVLAEVDIDMGRLAGLTA